MSLPLRITFLGTGTSSGVPMIGCHCEVCTSADARDKRLRSSILVESANTSFVVDTTPDFRYQMLRIHNEKLDALLYTHPHKDHTAGLDDIRPYNYFQAKAIDVYANSMTIAQLKREFAYVFEEHKYPGIPDVNVHEIDLTPFQIGDIPVTPILVWHHKMPVYGYRIGDFTYITDANRVDDTEKEKIKGSKVMVVNALRSEPHISHFTLDEASALVNEVQVPKGYFTHISHQLGKHEAVEKQLPAHLRLAYDGLVIEV
ncbi:phosphoribosyl 1,2-cyclic phosphate phosphodiesterase [Filimonas zeae]|uniref:Hydrolase n=1 Tax=Filimonas zeae TaxID=1737353 RepID=A0A917MZR8_9BACT|nr:MBL fold metallo-hydrolase [Filimonas zeae]MDR6341202.1 phosphoribosyl 1,2-cyclic phosphate phosphodiesterase [Filimonas zeae]GGH76816.1 hydrolase [Filimonas zeae]